MVTFSSPSRGIEAYRDTPYAHIAHWLVRERWNLDEVISLFSLEKPIYPVEQRMPYLDGSYKTVDFEVLDNNIELPPLTLNTPTFSALPALLKNKSYPHPVERTQLYCLAEDPVYPYPVEQDAYFYKGWLPQYRKTELMHFLCMHNEDIHIDERLLALFNYRHFFGQKVLCLDECTALLYLKRAPLPHEVPHNCFESDAADYAFQLKAAILSKRLPISNGSHSIHHQETKVSSADFMIYLRKEELLKDPLLFQSYPNINWHAEVDINVTPQNIDDITLYILTELKNAGNPRPRNKNTVIAEMKRRLDVRQTPYRLLRLCVRYSELLGQIFPPD